MLRFGPSSSQPRSTTVIERHHLPTGTVTHVQTTQPTLPTPSVTVTTPVLPVTPVYVAPVTPIVPTPMYVPPTPVVHHSRTIVATSSTIHSAHRPTQHVSHRHHSHHSHGATHLHSSPSFTPLQGIHKTKHHTPKHATIAVSTTNNSNQSTGHVQVTITRNKR